MRFVRRFATTGKIEIPNGIKKEAELRFIHGIVHHIETNKIPESVVLNIDQTPLKYVPCGKTTMAEKSSRTVPINGVSDKRMITATFTISLDGKFLPIQLIYAGKMERSIPKIKFPKSFSLSANPTHFSNETESLKLMKEIVIPYFQTERKKLGLAANHSGLIIMDVFKGQTTDAVQNEEEYDTGEAITNSKDQLADGTEDSDVDSEWEEENYDEHRNIFEDVF